MTQKNVINVVVKNQLNDGITSGSNNKTKTFQLSVSFDCIIWKNYFPFAKIGWKSKEAYGLRTVYELFQIFGDFGKCFHIQHS